MAYCFAFFLPPILPAITARASPAATPPHLEALEEIERGGVPGQLWC